MYIYIFFKIILSEKKYWQYFILKIIYFQDTNIFQRVLKIFQGRKSSLIESVKFLFDFTLRNFQQIFRHNVYKPKLMRAKLQRTRGSCTEDRQRWNRNYDAALHTFAHLENREERENTDASRAFIGSYELILL